MNPNDRITPDNINSTPAAPAQAPADQPAQQQSPFVAAPQAPAAPTNPVNTPADPAKMAVPPAPQAPAQPAQAAPTATPFALPAQMIQRVQNPGSDYYREDTMQKAHKMRDILHAQPKAWTYVPLGPGEKADSMLPVGINGYFVYIRKGVMVEVPYQIAQMVADSFNQDRLIGAEHDLSQNEDKQRALQK